MRILLKIFLCFYVLGAAKTIHAQRIDSGLWNCGLAYSLIPADSITSIHCKLLKQHAKTNLYPGVAVLRNEYTIVSDSNITATFMLPDSPRTTGSSLGTIHTLASHSPMFFSADQEGSPLPIVKLKDGYTINFSSTSRDTIQLITYQIIQTNQALMAKNGSTKENNAFGLVFNNQGWRGQGERKALIALKDKLNLINIYGVNPFKMVIGDLTHLEYTYDITRDSVFLIWFEGAAPDFKFEKKVLPYQQSLYDEIKKFDAAKFDDKSFGIIEKNDFGTDKQSKLLSVLYFIMFSVPWIILLVFIIFLIFKKKKKPNTES